MIFGHITMDEARSAKAVDGSIMLDPVNHVEREAPDDCASMMSSAACYNHLQDAFKDHIKVATRLKFDFTSNTDLEALDLSGDSHLV